MPDPKWQDHFLTDIVETQLLLLVHLTWALEDVGILLRGASAAAMRNSAEQDSLRPGVRSCLCAFSDLLERAAARPAPRPWEPRVIPGGAAPDEPARDGAGAGNGRAGNGHASNGSLPAGWRLYCAGDPDPDSDPDCA